MIISTHNSSPASFNFCISSRFGRISAAHAQPYFWCTHSESEEFNLFQLEIPQIVLKVSNSIHL